MSGGIISEKPNETSFRKFKKADLEPVQMTCFSHFGYNKKFSVKYKAVTLNHFAMDYIR